MGHKIIYSFYVSGVNVNLNDKYKKLWMIYQTIAGNRYEEWLVFFRMTQHLVIQTVNIILKSILVFFITDKNVFWYIKIFLLPSVVYQNHNLIIWNPKVAFLLIYIWFSGPDCNDVLPQGV